MCRNSCDADLVKIVPYKDTVYCKSAVSSLARLHDFIIMAKDVKGSKNSDNMKMHLRL